MIPQLLFLKAGLALTGCSDDKKKAGNGVRVENQSQGDERDGGHQPDIGHVNTNAEEEGCQPHQFYCRDNNVYRCIDGGDYEFVVDCGDLDCDENMGLCRPVPPPPYICDTENQFQLSFYEETSNQWQHEGVYSCGHLCPWDEGRHDSQPLFQTMDQSIYFEAPVCTNARQLRFIFDAKIRGDVKMLLRLPFISEPYELNFTPEDDCHSKAFAIADFESNADFRSVLREGTLPVILETGENPHVGLRLKDGVKQEIGDDPGQCFPGAYAFFGLSRVTIVSCYDDIKTPNGRSMGVCEQPSCDEIGAFRCFENTLEECKEEGWGRKENCSLEQLCSVEEGKCLSPVEVCGETQALVFNQASFNRYSGDIFYSCDALCPQIEADYQPLFYPNAPSFLSMSFLLPEDFQDPDVVHFDITSRVEPGGTQSLTVGHVDRLVEFEHNCVPRRISVQKNEGGLVEAGNLNVTVSPYVGVNINGLSAHSNREDVQCNYGSVRGGVASLSMTPCRKEYR